MFFLVLFAVGVIAVVAVVVYQVTETNKAKKAYDSALSKLAHEPRSPERRYIALTMGRAHARLVNNGKGVSALAELQIQNDIQAICANAPVVPAIDPGLDPDSVEGRLAKLNTLLSEGLIGAQEYVAKREALVGKD